MHELYELKEMLLKELKEYGSSGELSTGSLDAVDKLAHATKNLCKVIEACEDDEHSHYYPMEGDYRRGSYRSRRRDSMGRYARDGYARSDMADRLRGMMQDAPDERTRNELQKMIGKIEDMDR